MRRVPYLFAAAAVAGLAFTANPGAASPLASGLSSGAGTVPEVNEGLVQKVHSWHCRKRWSKRFGWHRHRRACGYSYYPYGAPFLSFGLFFGDDDRHHRRHFRKHRRKHRD